MKLAIVLLMSFGLQGAWHPGLTFTRRMSQLGYCAIQGLDIQSTRNAVAAGAHETNGLYINKNGSLNVGKMITFKGILCLAPIIGAEYSHYKLNNKATESVFIGLAGYSGYRTEKAVVSNNEIRERLGRK